MPEGFPSSEPESVEKLALERDYAKRSAALMEYAGRILREKSDFVVVRQIEFPRSKGSSQTRYALERATRFVSSQTGLAKVALRDRYMPSGERTVEVLTPPAAHDSLDHSKLRTDLSITRHGILFRGEALPEMISAAEAYVESVDAGTTRQPWRPELKLPTTMPMESPFEDGQIINLRDSESRTLLKNNAA
jgi:hypothetical protein